jgi:methionyl-tRNA formyltransferase
MQLSNIGMVIADTPRTKIYVQALVQNELEPNFALIMKNELDDILPGQTADATAESVHVLPDQFSKVGFVFNPSEAIEDTLIQSGISFQYVSSVDINSDALIAAVHERSETVFIYSGFGGAILRNKILGLDKKFLHIHGGYLPDYKGSTTNYYSLINDNECGASSIFMEKEIDSGPILIRRKFSPPKDRREIDYIYDSIFRAKVLVETVQKFKIDDGWHFEISNNFGGETYFIIHPVLKHIAILSNT